MKTARHAMVLDIISKHNIETQDELAEYLRHNGFDVTQATVSRDIKELRLIKVLGEGAAINTPRWTRRNPALWTALCACFPIR